MALKLDLHCLIWAWIRPDFSVWKNYSFVVWFAVARSDQSSIPRLLSEVLPWNYSALLLLWSNQACVKWQDTVGHIKQGHGVSCGIRLVDLRQHYTHLFLLSTNQKEMSAQTAECERWARKSGALAFPSQTIYFNSVRWNSITYLKLHSVFPALSRGFLIGSKHQCSHGDSSIVPSVTIGYIDGWYEENDRGQTLANKAGVGHFTSFTWLM